MLCNNFCDNHFPQDEATPCNLGARNGFTYIPGLATPYAINGTALLDFGSTVVDITATFTVTIDDVILIYVAFSNTSGNYLSKVFTH